VTPVQASTVSGPPAASARPATDPRATASPAQAPAVPFRALLLRDAADARAGEALSGDGSSALAALAFIAPAHAPPWLVPGSPSAPRSFAAGSAATADAEARSRRPDEDDAASQSRAHARHSSPDVASATHAIAGVPTLSAFPGATSEAAAASTARVPASLEDLLPSLVRRIAWSGDGQRGSVRLELGAGELAGATLLVHAEAGRVSVHLDVAPGTDTRSWQRRLHERLEARGVPTDGVEVT
jgi:hypothetical protein